MRIVITRDFYFELVGGRGGSARISSNLKNEEEAEDADTRVWNAGIDALESLVLAHFCSGVDVTAEPYRAGIETTVEAMINNAS